DLVAPDGGISADHRHIAAIEGVLGSFHGLQIGLQGDPVNGGGDLADAAGGGVDALAVLVGAGVLIAAGFGIGAGQIVVGEYLTGQQDGAVDPAGSQVDVVPAIGGTGAAGGAGAQHILEEVGLQVGGGHFGLSLGQGYGDIGALRRAVQGRLG